MKYLINLRLLSLCFLFFSASLINAKSQRICQKDIPYIITRSGDYQLEENITYNGSGNALTIQANNVKLSLGNHYINLTNPNATGIYVRNIYEFEIESDAIKNTSTQNQNGFGIHIINAQKGLVKNVFTINHLNGLSIESSSDILVKCSRFINAAQAGAFVMTSTNVTFDTCVFAENVYGLKLTGSNQDCNINNCDFPSSSLSNLLVQQINGLFIENCSFTNITGDPAKPNLVQLGDADPSQVCNDVIIRNCTIINRPSHSPLGNTAPEGLGIYQGTGFLVESCVIDIDNTNQDPAADLSGIHISNPGLGLAGTVASNVIIRDCLIQGPATDGLYPDVGSSGVVIEGCLVSGAQKDGIFLAGTTASTVRNNTVVNNGTNGIFLGETSIGNAVNNNVVNNNGFNPILSSLLPLGNGIAIATDSSANTLQHNEVFNNAVNGIDDQGTGNQIYYNTSYGNLNLNYNAATDIIIVSHPGDPAKAAENIAP